MRSQNQFPSSAVAGRKRRAADTIPNDRETIGRPIRGELSSESSHEISRCESEALLFTSLEATSGEPLIKQGQIYWNQDGIPMLVKRINRHADSITVLAFDQCLPSEIPAEVLLWKEEWVLQLDEERTLSLNQAKNEWNNEAWIMPWPEFATASHGKRVKNLVCRFAKQKSQPTVVRVGRGFKKIESNNLTAWIRCAVCRDLFHINQGWSYCRSCKRTSHDQCLTGETFFIRELHPRGKSDTSRTLQLAKREDPDTFLNAKCVCGADYTFKDIPTDDQSTSAGPVNDLAEKPIRKFLCDAGTEYFRIRSILSRNQDQSTLQYEIPSQFRVDQSGAVGLTVTVGKSLSHTETEEGMLVSPVKKIILDASMEVKLREKGVNITPTEVLTLAIRELYESLVSEHLNMAVFDSFVHVHVITAFPAGFDMVQRSAFTTGVKLACPHAQISVVPEPVAAFYYAASLLLPNPDSGSADLQKLDTESYVLFDIGATMLDIAWLQYGPDNDVRVIRDVGFELGANWAQLRTIDHFHRKANNTDAEAHIREQVQAYHTKRNGNQADRSMNAYRKVKIFPVYERFWKEYLEKVEKSLAKDFENHCEQGSMIVGKTHRNLVIVPDEPTDLNVIMCGGGAESEVLCKRIQDLLRLRGFKKDLIKWKHNPRDSFVIQGLREKAAQRSISYSPITFCIQHQKRGTGHRNGTDSELMVLMYKNQALEDPKLLYGQPHPSKLICFETNLNPREDGVLTFKATFGTPHIFVAKNGYLYADEKDAYFYNCAEVRIVRNKSWKGYRKALTVLQVTVDIPCGVVHCAGILYAQKKWSDRTTLAADLEVMIEEELEWIESKARTLKAFEELIGSDSDRVVLKKVDLAGCLNLNESNDVSSKFRA